MKTLLNTIGKSLFCTLSISAILVAGYLAIGVVGSLAMLDPSYMLFAQWPVMVRLVFVTFSLYLMSRAVMEDFKARGNGN